MPLKNLEIPHFVRNDRIIGREGKEEAAIRYKRFPAISRRIAASSLLIFKLFCHPEFANRRTRDPMLALHIFEKGYSVFISIFP
jgi:hypothetical protein